MDAAPKKNAKETADQGLAMTDQLTAAQTCMNLPDAMTLHVDSIEKNDTCYNFSKAVCDKRYPSDVRGAA